MRLHVLSLTCLLLTVGGTGPVAAQKPQNYPYGVPSEPWEESFGNHRAVLQIEKPAPRLPMAASGQRCRTQTISYHPRCNGRYHPEYPPDRGERRTLPFAVRSGGTKRHLLLLLPPLPSAKGIRILQWRIPSERKRTGCRLKACQP